MLTTAAYRIAPDSPTYATLRLPPTVDGRWAFILGVGKGYSVLFLLSSASSTPHLQDKGILVFGK